MFFLTTSMPTPRPDTSVTSSAVREAGREDQAPDLARRSSCRARRCRARAPWPAACRGSGRLPSSRTSMTMLPPWCDGDQRDRAVLGLALGQALGRHLDAVVAAVAHQVGQRVGDLLDQALVELGGLALRARSSTFLPSLAARSRSMRGKRLKTTDIGIMRIDITASCRSRVLRSRSARPAASCWCSAGSSALAVLRQHGLGDDEFADQVDQLVDLLDRDAQRRRLQRGGAAALLGAWRGGAALARAPRRPARRGRRRPCGGGLRRGAPGALSKKP